MMNQEARVKISSYGTASFVLFITGILLIFSPGRASATHDQFVAISGNGYEADQCHDFSKCGYNGPLLWNPYTIVASGLGWTKKHWDIPVLHGTRRGSELNQ